MKKKTFIVQLLDSKKPSRTSFTQVEDANFYSNDTDASLVFIPHEDTFDFQSAKVVMFNRGDESLVERDMEVTTEDGRKVASYELPDEIISHWGQWVAQPVFINGGEIYSGAIVPFSVERHLMHERPPKLTEVVTVTKFVQQSQELVNAMIQAEAQRITEEQVRQSSEENRVQAESERSDKYESYAQQFNDVITELSEEKDYHSLPEIAGARGGENTLGERLDKEHNEVTAQLAQTRNIKSWELDSKDREERGIVVFISDDARQEDWNNLRPIFNEENAPLCLAAIASKVGTGQYLTKEQLIQLESEGHEILSHSLDHSGEDRIPLASAQEAERQYKESKNVLRDMGLTVNNYAVPYGDYRRRERLLSKKHYRASRTSDYGNQSGLNLSPITTHELKTLWLDETWGKTDFEYFKTHIDLAVEKNALLIISTHGQQVSQTATKSVFRQVIQYAQQMSEVMTLNNALDIMGNIIEIGDYSYGIDNRSAKPGGHYVVGANGAVSQLNRTGKFNLATPFAEFPFGDNSYNLTYGELGDESPTGGGGTLRNVKTHINPHSPLQAFNYQTFKGYNSKNVYIRHLQSSFEFTDWELFINKPNYAVYTYTSSYTLQPKEWKALIVEPYTFPQNAPISVNPKYGAGSDIIYSTHIDGNGHLQISLYNTSDVTKTLTDKEWIITRVHL